MRSQTVHLGAWVLYVLDGPILKLGPATLSYVLMELHKSEFRIIWIITWIVS